MANITLPIIVFILGFFSFIFVNPYLATLTVALGVFSLIKIFKDRQKGKYYAGLGVTFALFPYFGLLIILLVLAYWATDRSLI